ncbi:MAG: DUF1501 domain-containing protein [Gemmataceae bacterium]|nr:DUF1501 domain-containing protein [Gemmataceae bacterium]
MRTHSRRQMLAAGAGLAGLSLADLLRAAPRARPKSVIYIVLDGGPSHIDLWDLKPDAPAEYRGPFKPIATSLAGCRVGELLPRQAKLMHRMALLRGVQSVENDHFLSEVYSGLPRTAGKRPAFGSAVSKLAGGDGAMPAYVALSRATTDQFEFQKPYYAGAGHAPFRPFGDAVENLRPARLDDRRSLLKAFDGMRRELDREAFDGLDKHARQAMEILSSPRVRDAFDLTKEPARVRERYGTGGKYTHQTVKSIVYPFDSKPFLLARRLVEAGVRVVTVSVSQWDHHSGPEADIFHSLKLMAPALDGALAALLDDLHERGLSDDVLTVVLGEFGRTPRISKPGPGREHWADAGCVLVAGGGLRMGQVIGATDGRAERPVSGKMGMQNVMATIYRVLGIDPATKLKDFSGRPQFLLVVREPVAELVAPA